ncbi:DUF6541 family protein [Dermabacter sp. HSID17554]|uniref:DUF6541 family protein n=1 Tax=Dermabacter sp. HSID17554 TaxID=2419511 RepID=UPI000F85D89E|nr:DUF6541 family protein [Dermabacter sp. HSID17554]RUP86494.1 hypothetical protein D8M36_03635 [Dermabacter sp. HSID17554]
MLLLIAVIAFTLMLAYVPGYTCIRVLRGSALLAVAFAPAISMSIAGLAAVGAGAIGVRWGMVPFALAFALLTASCGVARGLGITLPRTHLQASLMAFSSKKSLVAWSAALLAALAICLGPLFMVARTPAAILERYDALYHLNALAFIRDRGDGSSLSMNALTRTDLSSASYPAAFHDLASLVPIEHIPVVLNGSVLALALVPWVVGNALLAAVVFPRVRWAGPTAAVGAALVPASPVDLWIHLSPIPNLIGFAILPGLLAAAYALWLTLEDAVQPQAPRGILSARASSSLHAPSGWRKAAAWVKPLVCMGGVAFLALVGLALLHPNTAVTLLLLIGVLSAVRILRAPKQRRVLWAIPVLALAPVFAVAFTPIGARATGFSGGLQVPMSTAFGEVFLGLLTVWPMPLGVVMVLLWLPGLVVSLVRGERWLAACWVAVAVLYFDAAVDSPLNLSALYFRGQDRLSIPLAMLSIALMIPGIEALRGWLRKICGERSRKRAVFVRGVALGLAIVAALSSIPFRYLNAAKNLEPEYPGRGRFLQVGEREEFASALSTMDPERSILASPYSGAAHMYALEGAKVYFPVAGMALSTKDRAVIDAVPRAASDPGACALLEEAGIGYVYQERDLYQYDPSFNPLNVALPVPGATIFETDHSRLIEIDCR